MERCRNVHSSGFRDEGLGLQAHICRKVNASSSAWSKECLPVHCPRSPASHMDAITVLGL